MRTKAPLETRLADKILVGDGCWEWQAAIDRDGYGILTHPPEGVRSTKAHRIVYEWLVGPIPDGLVLDHLCRNRCCVRPDHLEPVTSGANVLRGESLQAANKAKDVCKRGHPFDEANTRHYINSRTGTPARGCRACATLMMREYRAAKRSTNGDRN